MSMRVYRPHLHHRWNSDSHYAQNSDEFSAHDRRRGQKKLLAPFISLREDVMTVVEVVELLRKLKRVLGQKRWFGSRNALFDHE